MEVQKYDEALDNLIKSKTIFNKIAEFKDPLEAIIYKERIE